jgi:AmmeMemoRadiSam system protein B
MALSSADVWDTPLGPVAVDTEARDSLKALTSVVVDDRAHALEHSLEVHLPFLQRVLGDARAADGGDGGWGIVPILVGRPALGEVADVLDRLWGGGETRIVISSDLSHYHDYATASSLDRETAAAIVARSPVIDPEQACGAFPVRGMLEAARRHDMSVELIDLRNSGDTAGPRDRVVGYGAFAIG